jgi:WD40 repeat protein
MKKQPRTFNLTNSENLFTKTSFVTTIRILPGTSQKYLISGAGDATIRVWEYMQGREVQTFNIREALGMPPAEADAEDDVTVFSFAICPTKSHIAAVIEKYVLILCAKIIFGRKMSPFFF